MKPGFSRCPCTARDQGRDGHALLPSRRRAHAAPSAPGALATARRCPLSARRARPASRSPRTRPPPPACTSPSPWRSGSWAMRGKWQRSRRTHSKLTSAAAGVLYGAALVCGGDGGRGRRGSGEGSGEERTVWGGMAAPRWCRGAAESRPAVHNRSTVHTLHPRDRTSLSGSLTVRDCGSTKLVTTGALHASLRSQTGPAVRDQTKRLGTSAQRSADCRVGRCGAATSVGFGRPAAVRPRGRHGPHGGVRPGEIRE